MWIFTNSGEFIRHSNIGRPTKSISELVSSKQWEIVTQRILHPSFHEKLSNTGEMCTPLGLRKNLPATVFKTLPVNCTGKLCHRMTEETISCNRGLNKLLWALILSVFCKISFVSNKLSCYNAQQQSNYSINNKQVKFIFHNQKKYDSVVNNKEVL